jgi:hypothetical protein
MAPPKIAENSHPNINPWLHIKILAPKSREGNF